MKKLGMLVLVGALLAMTVAPAMARSVGVEVDGKVYTFCEDGGDGMTQYEVDGKTFYVSEDEVIVREAEKPDLHLTLTEEANADAVAEAGTAERVSEVTVIEGAGAIAEGDDSAAASGEEYAAYAPYGMSCDAAAGKLYYMGAPVRVFEDAYGVDSGTAELSYFDASGAVDVRAKRDVQGKLTGLEALSEEEFASRDLTQWTNPEPTQIEMAATDGEERTPGERAAFFAPYAPFGLRYDAKEDKLYLNDRPVRNFLDVRSSNGENPTSGKFQGSMTQLRFDGEVDVTILRDYAQPDVNGEGKIIGIEATEATKP